MPHSLQLQLPYLQAESPRHDTVPSISMSLLHTFLPEHQFNERHHMRVNASPVRVLDMASQLHVTDFLVARLLLYLHAIPTRVAATLGKPSARWINTRFGLHDFTALDRDEDQEFAPGLAGRFWESASRLTYVEVNVLHAFFESGVAKLVMTFTARPEDVNTLLTTRTYVHYFNITTPRRSAPYWVLIRMSSGLVYRMML